MHIVAHLKSAIMVFGVVLALASSASAIEQKKYDAEAFRTIQAAGKPAIVHVSAPWCPTCKAQHSVIDELAKNSKFEPVTIFLVDFDSQKDVLKKFKASQQSTLIAFNGSKETGRLVGETKAKSIEDLVSGTIRK